MRRPQASGKLRKRGQRPLTVTRKALLVGKSDHMYRQMIANFFALSARFVSGRNRLANLLGVSGPQWTMIMAIAECSPEPGTRASALAERMNVSRPFVASETANLIRRGLIQRRPDPTDARGALLTLTDKSTDQIQRIVPTIQLQNDIGFGRFSRQQFQQFCRMLEILLEDSATALDAVDQMKFDRPALRSRRIRRGVAS